MPVLQNPRHEAFAMARAKGARLKDAYEDAGFAPDTGHACRLAKDPKVAERVAELRALQTGLQEASAEAVIAALLRVAKAGEAEATPASLKEVRLTLLEIERLRNEGESHRDYDRDEIQSKRY